MNKCDESLSSHLFMARNECSHWYTYSGRWTPGERPAGYYYLHTFTTSTYCSISGLLILQNKVIVFSSFVCGSVRLCVFLCVRAEVIHGTLWYHKVFMYYLLGSTYFVPHKTTFSHIKPLFTPLFPTFNFFSHFSPLLATFPHFSPLIATFTTFHHFSPLFPTFPHFLPLFATFHHFPPLFSTFPHFSSLSITFSNFCHFSTFFTTFPHF